MLPRRVAEHMKSQNWSAIGVEFLIVVLGVFVGIQAANWNSARLDRVDERRALELLLAEAENHVAYTGLVIHRAAEMQQDRAAAAALLAARSGSNADAVTGLANMTVFRDMTPIVAAYDELTASGDITLLRSPEVRSALAMFNSVKDFNDRMRREYIERAPDVLSLASPYMNVTYDPSKPLGYTAVVDWSAAGGDLALVNAVNRVMGEQQAFNARREVILEEARKLCAALGNELGRKCSPPDWVAAELQKQADK
jgi:hypothetical protein